MKKRVAYGLILCILIGTVGCGQGSGEGRGGRKTVVRFSYWGNGQEAFITEMIKTFEEKNPDIQIQLESLPWKEYWAKLEASAIGGAMPDVMMHHPRVIEKYVNNDLLVDLTHLEGVDYSKFPERITNLFKYNDRIYGVPKDFDSVALFYNKKLFDAKEISYPDESWDWATLIKVAQELTDRERDIYGFGAKIDSQQGYLNTIRQAGGRTLLENGKSGFNTPESKIGIRFWYDMINKYKVSPTSEQFADTSGEQLFSAGKIAMVFGGSWVMDAYARNEYIKDDFDVSPLPAGPAGQAVVSNSLCFSISTQSKHQEAARAFVTFLGNKESQFIEASYGGAIPAYEGASDAWVEYYKDYQAHVFVDALDYAFPVAHTLETNRWYELVKNYVKLMISGKISIDEGSEKLEKEMNEVIEEEF